MGLRNRLKKLGERSTLERHVLACPECDKEYVVAEWVRQSGKKDYHGTPPDVAALLEHEHEPSAFIDKPSGLPFLSREVSGMQTAFRGTEPSEP